MHISGLKQSRFLTRADVGKGVLVTIANVYQDNVAKEGAPEELKWCIAFEELEKPMVLNSTNGQIIASICHSEETDNWTGHKIVLYDDPNISFGGKLVGGIRARAPRNIPAAPQQVNPVPPRTPVAAPKPVRPQPQPAPQPKQPEPGESPDMPDVEIPF